MKKVILIMLVVISLVSANQLDCFFTKSTLNLTMVGLDNCDKKEDNKTKLECYDKLVSTLDTLRKNLASSDSKPITEPTQSIINEEEKKPFIAVDGVVPFIDISYKNKNTDRSNYSHLQVVRMYLGYKNNTTKKIVGIVSQIEVQDVFGNTLLELTNHQDTVTIKPKKRYKAQHFWEWNGSTGIYKKMWRSAQEKTYKAKVTITKVIFADGSTLGE